LGNRPSLEVMGRNASIVETLLGLSFTGRIVSEIITADQC
jgi:hypothetical protein